MKLHINDHCTVGKTLSIKLAKVMEVETIQAAVQVSETFNDRNTIDAILGRSPGWSSASLFDAQGAPLFAAVIALPDFPHRVLSASGSLVMETGEGMTVRAEVSDIKLELSYGTPLGALLSAKLTWAVTGDESDDAEALLGKRPRLDVILTDGGQEALPLEGAAA